jgi:glycosyltransferase 2 family protein
VNGPTPEGGERQRLGRVRDWVIGGLLLGGLVLAVQLTLGWGQLLAPWRTLAPSVLAVLILLSALSYGLRAVRVYDWLCLGASASGCAGRFPAVLRLSILHNTANNLLPMRAGELAFPWLMGRYFGHGFLPATAALLWIRLMDLHFLGLVAIGIAWLRQPAWVWPAAGLLWLAALGLLGAVGGLRTGWEQGQAGRLRRAASKALRLLAAAAPGSHARMVRAYLWTALIWLTKFLAFAALLRHFLPVDLWRALVGVMGAELSSVLPFHGIAGSGSYELAAVAALVPVGVDPKAALAGAVNLHVFVLGVTLLLGALAFLLPKARPEASGPPHRPAGSGHLTPAPGAPPRAGPSPQPATRTRAAAGGRS